MHTSAVHAGASGTEIDSSSENRVHIRGGGAPKSKIERKVRLRAGRDGRWKDERRCSRGEKDEQRRTNTGIDFNGERSRVVLPGGGGPSENKSGTQGRKNEKRIHYCMQVRGAGAQLQRRAGEWRRGRAAIGRAC